MQLNSKLSLGLMAALALATPAVAADEAPKFAYSFNIGATNDYVFRGIAQNKENPSVQGGIDLTYGIAYFGLWGSNIDFGTNAQNGFGPGRSKIVNTEIDVYGGIKPVLGPATFDLGVLLYAYPNGNDNGPSQGQAGDQTYVEIKGGVSGAFIPKLDKLTLGGVVFYSPEYIGKQGSVWTVEGNAAYELPALGPVTPTVSGTIGASYGDSLSNTVGATSYGKFNIANGADSYNYWNIGVTFAVEKFTFDFRYWDTDISHANNFCKGGTFNGAVNNINQCDGQFAFLGKFTY